MPETDTKNEHRQSDQRPKRVVMLLANPFTHDTRVHKQAQTLIQWGLEVHIVCIAKPDLATEEVQDGIHIHRVPVKDESVFRVFQGITKLGSPEIMRAWLSTQFREAPVHVPEKPAPQRYAPPQAASHTRVQPAAFENTPQDQAQSNTVPELDEIDDAVCPLPPIEPAEVPRVPPLETKRMRLLDYPAKLSARSASRIQRLEDALLSEDSRLLISKASSSNLNKPARGIAHIGLRLLRVFHRVIISPLSAKARIALSKETSRATKLHAHHVREHAVATTHARREAVRQTKLRDAKYIKEVQHARTQAALKAHAQADAKRSTHEAASIEHHKIQDRIQKQAVAQAKQDAIASANLYKEELIASKKEIKRRAVWKKRFRIVLRRIPSAVRIIGFNDEVARTAYKLKPDLILAHDCNTLLAGKMLKEATGSPLVYDSHELFLERNIGSRRRWVDKACWWPIERACIGSTDAVFTVAEGIARHLEAQYRIPEVYLLRNVQPYEPPPAPLQDGEPSIMHQELGLAPSVRIVIYPGAITLNRGIEFMIDAAPMLDNAVFVVMGYANSEPYMHEILKRAKANGSLDTSIYFKDAVPIDDVGRWVAGASLGVVPTQGVCMSYKFEASNKMFHCLMAGVPLAMSDHPEKRILADRRGVGVLFDETSPESIAEAINTTLNDEAGMARMHKNCLQAALELNWENEVHRYLTIMSGLLPGHTRRVPAIHIRTPHDAQVTDHGPCNRTALSADLIPAHT